jgi:hypothetical protein
MLESFSNVEQYGVGEGEDLESVLKSVREKIWSPWRRKEKHVEMQYSLIVKHVEMQDSLIVDEQMATSYSFGQTTKSLRGTSPLKRRQRPSEEPPLKK